ncbi:hypothetical protein [Solimonas sp. SE-A11]|uniref:hypothetical protein n=1 Tax=Solimonas sp. SE-A11 TaxID=3054954 RepID=UPI00259C9D89|nr:hypothetical protein [Solimonas sp. SE-A11]MDM4773047.1 hypothetical protein [Solimonas sp. SE-A11]
MKHFLVLLLATLIVGCQVPKDESELATLREENAVLKMELSMKTNRIAAQEQKLGQLTQLSKVAAIAQVCNQLPVLEFACPRDAVQAGRRALDGGVAPDLREYARWRFGLIIGWLVAAVVVVITVISLVYLLLTPSRALLRTRREQLNDLPDVPLLKQEVKRLQGTLAALAAEVATRAAALAAAEKAHLDRKADLDRQIEELERRAEILRKLR